MNIHSANAMAEATRLVREGRLNEAMTVLRGGASGRASPASDATESRGARASRTIDVDPATGDPVDRGPAPGFAQASSALKDLLERFGTMQGNPLRRGMQRTGGALAPQPMPDGARFLDASFTDTTGSRPYKLYIPSTLRPGLAPALVVMLHGCTQSPDDFAAGTRMNEHAEAHGLLVVYPGQPQSANAQKCWNWFSPADQGRDGGEPAMIAGITRQVIREHGADSRRVYVAGLSAGGAAAAIMGATYPDLYAAIGVHSGLACGAARDIPSAFTAMRQGGAPPAAARRGIVPTIVFHADRDGTVHPVNGDHVIAQSGAAALRAEVQRGQVPGGHGWTRTLHRDAKGSVLIEQWVVHGGGHAWSGGCPAGSYTDPRGPDASREMLRFFLDHGQPAG